MSFPMIPMAIAAAGAGVSAIGKVMAGNSAASADKARAQALETNAQMDLTEAGLKAQQGLVEDERVAARLATEAGAGSGGGLRGNATAILNDLGNQSLMKARNTVYGGETQAWAARNDAAVARAQAKSDKTQGLLGAAGSLLGGAAKLYSLGTGH
ncbi:MAG TPA: hypothetical protein VFH92_13140 [Phenylobacterium sp.]|nr:hypothetical protein [Phenylobacterium sp.]